MEIRFGTTRTSAPPLPTFGLWPVATAGGRTVAFRIDISDASAKYPRNTVAINNEGSRWVRYMKCLF